MVPVDTPTKLPSNGAGRALFAGGSALPALGPRWWSLRLRFASEVGHYNIITVRYALPALDKTMR